jgi:DUF4097 and DUF4098 domain-containing protein YvlB
MKYLRIVLVLLAAATLTLAGEDIRQKVDASPNGKVEIDNLSGSVEVTGWDRDEVEITGTLGQGTERLDVERKGDRITIEVVLPSGRNNRIEGTDLEIRVPRGSELEVSTVSASIDISDVDGSMELNSVSGSVHLEGKPEDVEISNVSGRITVEARLDRGEFDTVSGHIEARLDLDSNSRVEFGSVTGSIDLTVPKGLNADFEISTFSGQIDCDFGPNPRKTSRYTPGRELNFSTGKGGARVSANSFSGRVTIEED